MLKRISHLQASLCAISKTPLPAGLQRYKTGNTGTQRLLRLGHTSPLYYCTSAQGDERNGFNPANWSQEIFLHETAPNEIFIVIEFSIAKRSMSLSSCDNRSLSPRCFAAKAGDPSTVRQPYLAMEAVRGLTVGPDWDHDFQPQARQCKPLPPLEGRLDVSLYRCTQCTALDIAREHAVQSRLALTGK